MSPFSPSIIFALGFSLYYFLKSSANGRVLISRKLFFLSLTYVAISIFCVILNKDSFYVVIRNITILLMFIIVKFPDESNSKYILDTMFLTFLVELIFRLGIYGFSMNIYDYKKSLLLPDTNFLGLLFVPVFFHLWNKMEVRRRVQAIFLIFFTMSRTSWLAFIGLMLMRLVKKYIYFFTFLIAIIPWYVIFIFKDFLKELDGSLSTKVDIYLTLFESKGDIVKILLFGVGKDHAASYGLEMLGKKVYTGHTIPGNILEYGLVNVILIISIVFNLTPDPYRKFFLFFLVLTGMTGLFPYSYLPITIMLLQAVYYFNYKEKLHV